MPSPSPLGTYTELIDKMAVIKQKELMVGMVRGEEGLEGGPSTHLTGSCTEDDAPPVRCNTSVPIHDVLCHMPPDHLQPCRPRTITSKSNVQELFLIPDVSKSRTYVSLKIITADTKLLRSHFKSGAESLF